MNKTILTMEYHIFKKYEKLFNLIPGTYDEENKTVNVEFKEEPKQKILIIDYKTYKDNQDKYELIPGTYNKITKMINVVEKELKNWYVKRIIETRAGKTEGHAGPFTKGEAERKAEEDTYSEYGYIQYCSIYQAS